MADNTSQTTLTQDPEYPDLSFLSAQSTAATVAPVQTQIDVELEHLSLDTDNGTVCGPCGTLGQSMILAFTIALLTTLGLAVWAGTSDDEPPIGTDNGR